MTIPPPRRRGRRRQLTVAVIGALGVHAAFFALFVLTSSAPPTTALIAGGDQGVMTVTLISASQSQVASAQAPTPTPLDILHRRLVADAAAEPEPVQPPSPHDAAALLKLFDVEADQPAKTSASASRAAGGAPGKGARIIDPMSLASMPAALQAEANAGPLWPQVSRCWRPTGSNARVSMLIKLEPSGQLADPPIIFRSGGQPTPYVTAAEQAATRAVWACAPYTIRAATSTAYNLVFRDGAAG